MTNPILAFSARRRMRSWRTPLLLTAYAAILAVVAILAVYGPFLEDSIQITSMSASVNGYGYLLILQFMLIVLVAPAMTAGSLSGERERQTLDLLLVTDTSAAQIVLGKLLESFGFLALMILTSLPVLSLVLLTGGATFGEVLVGVLFLLLTAFACLTVGIFCSTFFKRTSTATVVSYLAVFGIGVVTLVPLWYDVHRIDMMYRVLNQVGRPVTEINYQSIAFSTNPGLGLFSLLRLQTGMTGFVDGFLWSFSYTLANTISYLPFDRYLVANIGFMAAAGVLLTGLAALRLRSLKPKRAKGKAKK